MKLRDTIRILKTDGWFPARQKGSHRQFKHPTKPGKVTVGGKDQWMPHRKHAKASLVGRIGAMKYLVILEPTDTGYSAYSPDMDGCVAAGAIKSETMELMREALVMHVEALLEDGLPVPQPSSEAELIEVAA